MKISKAMMSICAALAVPAAGCGGGGSNFKSDYQKQRPALNQLGTDIGNALQTANGKSDSQLEVQFTGLAARAGSALGQLAKLKPDSKSSTSFSAVQSDLAKVQQDLGGIAASARANSASAAKSATETLIADASTLKGAGAQLKSDLGITGNQR